MSAPEPDNRRGLFAALGAFFIWGLLPLYIHTLAPTPAVQIMAHRVIWACLFVFIYLAIKRDLGKVWSALRDARTRFWLLGSATLISLNWLVYVWAVSSGHVIESSLGYFINPLFSVLMGVFILKEQLSRAQWFAVALATIGVIWIALNVGRPPWIALALAFTFGSYGLIRKQVVVESVAGLGVETLLITPLMLLYIAYTIHTGSFTFGRDGLRVDLLLIASGAFTAIPLVLFAYGVRRVPLTTIGLLQYLGPTLQFLSGVLFFHEPFGHSQALGFGLIWAALAVYAAEGFWRNARGKAKLATP